MSVFRMSNLNFRHNPPQSNAAQLKDILNPEDFLNRNISTKMLTHWAIRLVLQIMYFCLGEQAYCAYWWSSRGMVSDQRGYLV